MFPFIHNPNPSILHSSRTERIEAIDRLIVSSSLRRGYYLMLLLSVTIVTAGLLENNTAVIIGGMILAPLIVPILLLSLSIVTRSIRGALHALKVIVLSLCLVFILSNMFTKAVSLYAVSEIFWIPTTISPTIYLIIAFCSGVAAAFAWVKEDMAASIAGVAISVSLLPPLCAVGIGSALGDYALTLISLKLFLLNLIGMLIAALLVFFILGFFHEGQTEEKALEKNADAK